MDDARQVPVPGEDEVRRHPRPTFPECSLNGKTWRNWNWNVAACLIGWYSRNSVVPVNSISLSRRRLDLRRLRDVVEVGAVQRHVLPQPGPLALLRQLLLRALAPLQLRPHRLRLGRVAQESRSWIRFTVAIGTVEALRPEVRASSRMKSMAALWLRMSSTEGRSEASGSTAARIEPRGRAPARCRPRPRARCRGRPTPARSAPGSPAPRAAAWSARRATVWSCLRWTETALSRLRSLLASVVFCYENQVKLLKRQVNSIDRFSSLEAVRVGVWLRVRKMARVSRRLVLNADRARTTRREPREEEARGNTCRYFKGL